MAMKFRTKAKPPASVTAAGRVASTASAETYINVTWSSPPAQPSPVAALQIYRNGDYIAQAAATARSYSDVTAVAGLSYSYTVRVVTEAGKVSADSVASNAAVRPAPPVWAVNTPAALTRSLGATVAFSPYISNADGDAVSYTLTTALAGYTVVEGTGLLTVGPAGGNVVLRAKDASGMWDDHTCAFTVAAADTTPPSVPTGLVATAASSSQINLTWAASTDTGGSGLAGYRIYRSATELGTYAQIGTSATTTYSASGLSASTPYWFKVSAYDNAANASEQSTAASATTEAASSGQLLFLDTFNYVVDRNEWNATASPKFLNAGWLVVKREPDEPRACGWIYTVDSIPGYTGQLPSSSGRVICFEGKPYTEGYLRDNDITQTDFYVEWGTPGSNRVPPNVWYQFWVYVQDYGDQRSNFNTRAKFLYPSPTTGAYTDTSGTYMITPHTSSYETDGSPANDLPNPGPRVFWNNSCQWYEPTQTGAKVINAVKNQSVLGPNVAGNQAFNYENRWYLMKFNFDVRNSQGRSRSWRREMGGQWEQLSDWWGGVTNNGTFIYNTQPDGRDGSAVFKIPTTWGVSVPSDVNLDAWVYMADFAIATDESALPVYTGY